ncbi:MAG: cadherin-like beta sandwich domain-containing protein, partial [Bacilli bacterium]|nr:cadherin-like beta sandwich domain-containing protein [Bacilli bacterium]
VSTDYYLKDAETIAGNQSIPTYDGNNIMTGNLGNGYARITAKSGVMGDTFLDSITLNDGDIPIEFYPWTLEYTVDVDKDTPTIKIDAVSKDPSALVTGLGTFNLIPGENIKKIIVTTSDGASKVYTIKVNKEPSDDPTPTNILLKNPQSYLCASGDGYCIYQFNPETTLYEISLPFATEQISLEAILKTPYQTVEYRDVTDGDSIVMTEPTFELKEGIVNIFEVEITSESGKESTIYTYKVSRDDRGNNNLKSLEIKDPTVDLDFESLVYEYYLTVPSDCESLDLEAIPQNPLAKVEVLYNENFQTGLNDVRVVVTAPNGNSKTYLLHVFKEQSSNIFLQSLTVKDKEGNELELNPTFNKMLVEYIVNVGNEIDEVTIEAEAEEGTVTGDIGTQTLKSGNNQFDITVTSPKGDTQVYTINIVKAKNSNSNLLNIEVEGYELSPEFTSGNKNYSLTIPQSVTKLNVTVTPEEETTTYTIRGNNNLNSASNTIVITSIAEDKSYQVYQISVRKEASENNYLTDIEVST